MLTVDSDLQLDIENVLLLSLLQIGLDGGSVLQGLSAERLKSIGGNDPRADGRTKVLAVEGAERDVLPSLDITSAPVVEQNVAENIVLSIIDIDRVTHLGRAADEAAKLNLVVKSLASTGDGLLGRGSRVGEDLALGTANRGTRDDNAGRSAVVANREVGVVGLEGVLGATEEDTNLEGVVVAGVEISVVANLHGEVHLDLVGRDQSLLLQGNVIAEDGAVGGVVGEDALKLRANATVDGAAKLSKLVQGRLAKESGIGVDVGKRLRGCVKGKSLKINNVVADSNTSAGIARFSGEDAKRQVVNREVAAGVGGDPRLNGGVERHCVIVKRKMGKK